MVNWIKSIFNKKPDDNQNEIKFGFESLTPTNEADESGLYCGALDEAFDNPDHYNIALTGGYGTGKSSIIETYLTRTKRFEKKNVLRISLASFSFRNPESSNKKRQPFVSGRFIKQNEEQVLLEIAVLQQIIFQIQKKTIFRKFRKKITQGYLRPILFVSLSLIAIVSSLLFWKPELFFGKIFDCPKETCSLKSWLLTSFIISIISTGILLVLILQKALKFKISKLEVKSVGVNLNENNTKFSLDSHLDELIYLMKKGKVSLIVFEDLDRTGDFEIFEKLREINHILRYSPDLEGQKVKFLYVLRESIFKTENEKNKFFDLIIPVVPFISVKNAQSKMLKFFANEIESISAESRKQFESVIKIAALCIDEMRTVKSIYNDYLIYLKLIEKNDKEKVDLPKNEILAIVIYKNLFPTDFEAMNSGTSKLEMILEKRVEFLDELIELRKVKLKSLKVKLNNIHGEQISTIKELRMEYINSLLNTLQINFNIYLNGNQNMSHLRIEDLSNDEYFELIESKGIRVGNVNYSFDQIERKNKNNLSYKDRIEIIQNRSNGQELIIQDKIKSIEKEIKSLRKLSFGNLIRQAEKESELKNLLKEFLTDKTTINDDQKNIEQIDYSNFDFKIDLVALLIIEGHINLNYSHYTSIFHDGDLSFNDRALYMQFRTGKVLGFEQHFDNPKSFLKQFIPSDWNKRTFFCEELFDEMLYTQTYNEQLDSIFESGTDYHLRFLAKYIPCIPEDRHDPKSSFIKKISGHIFPNWKNFSEQAINLEEFDNISYDVLLVQLMLNQDSRVIKIQNENSVLTEYISSKKKISSIFPEDKNRLIDCENNLLEVFKDLKIHFYQLNESNQSWVLDLIFNNELYEINLSMLRMWGNIYQDDKLLNPTYANVLNSILPPVKKYVSDNLFEYTNNILFELKNETGSWIETEDSLIELFKSEEVDSLKIIEEVDYFEFELDKFHQEYWETIVHIRKLKCTWNNIILYYEQFGINDALIALINDIDWISKIDLYNAKTKEHLEYDRMLNFWEALLEIEIQKDSLKEMNKKFNYYISESIISAVTFLPNLEELIIKRAFNPEKVIEVYEQIKTHFKNQLTHLKFAKEYMSEILNVENNDTLFQSLEKDELVFIARNNFSKQFFEKSFEQTRTNEQLSFTANEAEDILLLIKKYHFTKNTALLQSILGSIKMNDQINFFIWLCEEKVVNKVNLNDFLIQFTGHLLGLNQTVLKFRIEKNKENVKFVKYLKEFGLINRFKDEGDKGISFYRNKTKS